MNEKINWHYIITLIYFSFAGIEFFAEIFAIKGLSLLTRIVLPIVLGILYFILSKHQSKLFYLLLGLLLISNVLFLYRYSFLFIFGIIAFILLRIVSLIIIFKITKERNYLQIIVASFPFLVIFFYLISVTNEITDFEFNTLILQSILISILAGVSITNYLKNENRQHSWLLISSLLFIGLRFIVFIERFIVSDITITINRPIEVVLNTFAFYTFLKYVTEAESSDNKLNL